MRRFCAIALPAVVLLMVGCVAAPAPEENTEPQEVQASDSGPEIETPLVEEPAGEESAEYSVADKLAMIDGEFSQESSDAYQALLNAAGLICPALSEDFLGDIAVFSAQTLQENGQDRSNRWLLKNLPIAAAGLQPGEFDCVELASVLLTLQVEDK